MRIHIYVHSKELEYLHKAIKGEVEASEFKVSTSPSYFEDSYLVDIPYTDFVRLTDNQTFISLISL